jgi:2-dehydro-3-deoxyphosphogluconate aldolase / (4S)-4-hydroxy-2-oxoglutarate aldolase
VSDPTQEFVELLGRAPVLPVATVDDADQAEAAARAQLAGGLSCFEIAFRNAAAAGAIARLASIEGLVVGAGTVLTVEQVEAAVEAGARFAVSPGLDEEIVAVCREHRLPHIPGVATPSEIQRARTLGMRVLKLFPASQLGGPAFIRAVSPVFPDVRFVPTGGIDLETAPSYLSLPTVLACGGTWIVKPELLRAGRFDEVERLGREAADLGA